MAKVKVKTLLAMTALSVLLVPMTLWGEYYQYEDESGAIHFTDNPANIPKKFKKKQNIRDDGEENSGNSVMRVKIKNNHVLLPVTVCYRGNEVKATFVLDTGASVSTISPDLANKLNIDPNDADVALAQGIGGGVQVIGHTKLDYVLVGPNRKYDVDIMVVESAGYDGLLGMNFLRELRYHVDFNTSTIRWGD